MCEGEGESRVIKSQAALMTPTEDKVGVDVHICVPEWFKAGDSYAIANASPRLANMKFSSEDLNYTARVLYAEASGSAWLPSKDERLKEKEAILNVKAFRLNRTDYPNRHKAQNFREVCDAPNQFESVFKGKKKFVDSEPPGCGKFKRADCDELNEALAAVRTFLASGPNPAYVYDHFLGKDSKRKETWIGKSVFWLSDVGARLYAKER